MRRHFTQTTREKEQHRLLGPVVNLLMWNLLR